MLSAAVELLNDREYEQIQIREVAERAGVALATLYRYFPSKEQLYAHALVNWGDSFERRVRTQDASASTDADRIRAMLRRTVRSYVRHPNFYKLTTIFEVTTDATAREIHEEYALRFARILRELLQDTDPRDADMVLLLATSVLGAQLRQWSLGRVSARQVFGTIDEAVALIYSQPRMLSSPGETASPDK